MTPAAVHNGEAHALHAARARVLSAAHQAHPRRFVNGALQPPSLPTAVWINRPVGKEAAQ